MKPTQLLATLLTISSLSAAWPSADEIFDLKPVEALEGYIFPRQNDNGNSRSTSARSTAADSHSAKPTADHAASNTEAAATTDGSAETTVDRTQTGKIATTGKATTTGKHSGSKTTTSRQFKTTVFDPLLPAGGIELQTPALIDGAQYYKVGDYITFGWNYTSLSVTPTAIDIFATCVTNQALYTIALNQTVESSGLVVWDTKPTPSPPFVVATYTLIIYDADSSISATPAAGYLSAFDQYTFGMYTPQPYVPWKDYQCVACNSATSMERQTVGFLFGMAAVTVLSFTWFASGFGIF